MTFKTTSLTFKAFSSIFLKSEISFGLKFPVRSASGESDVLHENPETLLFSDNGNLQYLSAISQAEHSEKAVYKIAGYLSFKQKNILSSILERIEILERESKKDLK